MQQLLHNDEERYLRLLHSVTDYIYTVTVENGEAVNTYHGPACEALTGYTQEDFEEDEELWYSMVEKEDRAKVLHQAKMALKGGNVPTIEHRIRHKNGMIRWVKNTIVLKQLESGEVVGYDGLITDITERKYAEHALREGEKRYRRLVNSITDYIYTVTVKNGRAVETEHGPACISVTGYTSDEYKEDPQLWVRMVHSEDRKEVVKMVTMALQGIDPPVIEHRIIHKNGSIRWVQNAIVLRRNERGRVISYDGLISDITKRKQAEQLADLKHKQLIQAEKMATLGILVSGVAHEINNPNNFIMLNAKLFRKIWADIRPVLDEHHKQDDDFYIAGMPYMQAIEKVEQLITGMSEGAERIKNIVQGLKDFAGQDSGEQSDIISMNEVIQDAILIVQNQIKKSTNHFDVQFSADLPKIRGNYQQLEQVIINFLTNSCQALESKEDSITVRSKYHKPNREIIVEVADTGKGISKEEMKHIFDPFFTTKREHGGTGLGLSISYNIIKDHGGKLSFESVPGVHTTARIRIPIVS